MLTTEILLVLFYFICLSIQVLFLIGIFSKLAFFKEIKKNYPTKPVSVIIATHNEYKNLTKLLPLILQQDHEDFELIIVLDRCSDNSLNYLKEQQLQNSKIRIINITDIPENISPKKYALTQGILLAKNEVILLTDADCNPTSSEWIRRMTSKVLTSGKEVCIGYSPYIEKPGLLNLMIRYETFYTGIQYLSIALAGYPYMGVGRNLCYTRQLFLKNKGFNNHINILSGDDDLFGNEAFLKENISIEITRESQMISIPKTTFVSWWRQKMRHLSAGLHYNKKTKWILGSLILSHLGMYLTALMLVINFNFLGIVIIGYIFRLLLLTIVFKLIARQLHENFSWYLFPVLDFIYILNYILFGLSTVFAKKIKWT